MPKGLKGFLLHVLCLALLLGFASKSSATELSYFTTFTNVDYVSAGVGGLRETGFGDIHLTGVSGTVKKAYLYWHGHGKQGDYDPSLTNAMVFINGTPVQGQVIGTSGPNGWNFSPYNFYFGQAFRADVTDVITGNGSYTLSDFDPLPFSIQGASLVVLFDDGITTNNKDITLFDGCDQNSNNPFDAPGWNISIPNVSYQPGDSVSLEFHVSDGQLIYNESPLLLNQNVLAPFGAIFSGSAQFDLLSGFRSVFFTGSLWDIREFNIGMAPFLVPGNNNVLVTTGYQDDDLTVVLTVLKSRTGSTTTPPPNNHAPVLNCPGSFTFDCVPKGGMTNTTTVIVQDADGDPLTVTWSVNGVQVRQDNVPAGTPVTSAVLTFTKVYALGNYNISVTVADGKGGIQNCQSSVTVTSIDALAPVIDCGPTIRTVIGTNGVALIPNVLTQVRAIDSCTPSNQLVYAQSPAAGTVVQVGTNVITVSVTDLSGNVGTCSLNFEVTSLPPPPPPVNDVHAYNDSLITTLNVSATTTNVLLNDVDDAGHTLSIKSFDGTSAKGGIVIYQGNGKFTYTPPLNYSGSDSFTYVAMDVYGNSSSATVLITIPTPPTNRPPLATNDVATTLVGVPVTIAVLGNDADPDGNPLTVTTFTQPIGGSVTWGTNNTLVFTPSPAFIGTAVFNYTISDGKGGTATATVTVGISAGGCELFPIALPYGTVKNLAINSFVCDLSVGTGSCNFGWLSWTGNGTDSYLLASLSGNGNSSTYINPDNTADHSVTAGDWIRSDNCVTSTTALKNALDALEAKDILVPVWDYTRCQSGGNDYRVVNFAKIRLVCYQLCGADKITFKFLGFVQCGGTGGVANHTPVAKPDSVETLTSTPVTIKVLANDSDSDGDVLSLTKVTAPGHGTATISNGQVIYTPVTGYVGCDTFTYTISDGHGGTATTTVTVTIRNPNRAPVANPDTATTTSGATVNINVAGNDTDPDGDDIYVYTFTQPVNGTVTLSQNGTLNYKPTTTFVGTNTFTYVLTDGKLYSTSTVKVVVTTALCAKYTTFTQGGWGASPSGNNPGTILNANFSKVYSCNLQIGSKYYLTFTSAGAITAFLPQGGTAAALTKSQTNPTQSISVFAGQVLALKLNVDFSSKGITKNGIGSLRLASGKLKGWKVDDFLSTCLSVMGGQSSCVPTGLSISDLNDIASSINQNYDNGTSDNGYLTTSTACSTGSTSITTCNSNNYCYNNSNDDDDDDDDDNWCSNYTYNWCSSWRN